MDGRFPSENSHRNIIRTLQIAFHLDLEVIKGVKREEVVETFLIITMTTLDFSVMPRSARSDELVVDVKLVQKYIKRMNSVCFLSVSKLAAIIGLNNIRSISEIENCSFYEINGTETAVFFVSVDKTFTASFFKHSVLIEFFIILTDITSSRNELYVHLPLFT